MLRLFNGISCITNCGIDMCDGMTDDACNPGMGGGIVEDVIVRIVEFATEEWHRVMTAGAPTRGIHAAIPLHRHPARFLHAE